MAKESQEDLIRRLLGEQKQREEADAADEKLFKENPRQWLRGSIGEAVAQAMGGEKKAPAEKKEGEEPDDGGFLTAIFGGKGS